MRYVKYEDKQKGVDSMLREGDRNKEGIFHFIFNNATRNSGVTKTRIQIGLQNERLKLSRPTIDLHLNELMREGRIYRTGKKYFIQNSLFNDVLSFSRLMSDSSPALMDGYVIELDTGVEPYRSIPKSRSTYNYPDEGFDLLYPYRQEHPTPRHHFMKEVAGSSLSKDMQKKFLKNRDERLLFEYVNRLGAFITYIFIQALRPNDLAQSDKRDLANSLIGSSIKLDTLFDSFRKLITQAGLTHITSDELRDEFQEYDSLWELDMERFVKLSEIFKTFYPSIYGGLENFWYQSTMYWMKVDEANSGNTDCKHTWEPYEYFKIGTHHRCRKCKIIVTDAFHKKNFSIR